MSAMYITPFGSAKGSRSAWKRGSNSSSGSNPKGEKKEKITFGRTIKEYTEETSLHGPKYITDDGNHPFEK